jgi:hypothetical protein
MSHRPIAGLFLLFVASCLSSPPPPPANSAAPAASAKTPDPAASGNDACAKIKIHSKDEFEACNKKCNDDGRDQQRQCSDPQCQQGIGQGIRLCLGKCEDDQKSSRAAKCYKE